MKERYVFKMDKENRMKVFHGVIQTLHLYVFTFFLGGGVKECECH